MAPWRAHWREGAVIEQERLREARAGRLSFRDIDRMRDERIAAKALGKKHKARKRKLLGRSRAARRGRMWHVETEAWAMYYEMERVPNTEMPAKLRARLPFLPIPVIGSMGWGRAAAVNHDADNRERAVKLYRQEIIKRGKTQTVHVDMGIFSTTDAQSPWFTTGAYVTLRAWNPDEMFAPPSSHFRQGRHAW